jgi:hypothetical protein
MQKESFIINRNTLVHVSTLLGHLQGELFRYRYTRVAIYSLFSAVRGPRRVHASKNNAVHSQQHILTQL